MIPTIYKGDDTDFQGAANLCLKLDSEVDLTNCRVEFVFLGQKRTFTGAANDQTLTLDFVFTAAETAVMPVGTHRAKVRVFDAEGRVRTVAEPRIRVTDDIKEAYAAEGIQQIEVAVARDYATITEKDIFDCSATVTDLKERLAYLWEKCGGTVINRSALDYGDGEDDDTDGGETTADKTSPTIEELETI